MSSNVIVDIPPVAPFQQANRKRREVLNFDFSNAFFGSTATDPVLRVAQLEQNIRFLQEQHHIMLTGLHREVEVLRQRNRDLQLQTVFKTPNTSPDEDQKKNGVSLQVEIMQRDLAELRTNLNEAQAKNVQLQAIVDGKSEETPRDNLTEKLEDSERMVRRLLRENEEQRKEIISLRTSASRILTEYKAHTGRGKVATQNQSTQTTRFPPLQHQHTYWNNSSKNSSETYFRKIRNNGGGNDRAMTVLPHLRTQNGPSSSQYYHNNTYQQGGNHKRNFNGQNRRPQEGGSRTFRSFNRESEHE